MARSGSQLPGFVADGYLVQSANEKRVLNETEMRYHVMIYGVFLVWWTRVSSRRQ